MNPQLAPNTAQPIDPAASPGDTWETHRRRIHTYVHVQRTRLTAIQRELSEHLSHLRHDLDALRSQSERLASENSQLQEQLAQRPAVPDDLSAAAGPAAAADLQGEYDDLQRRYEMALEDLRAERAEIAQLESKLQRAAAGQPAAAGDASGSDWESQKRRLLAALESDFDETDEDDRRDRLSIEETIRRTDAAVAAKEREIEQLQNLLQEQSSNIGSMAVGAAAVAEVLDKDEIVRQERENLQTLQDEWREKLRHAEVEISVQRARLARHQAELEERARQIEQQSRHDLPQESGESRDKPQRGRWLRRLGLGGGDDE